ncbi:MAG: hypothetical protein EG825_10950 [Rhodocyclaceae bacterium]|nr:hypothetical protein [Rhodocyclaceae bacterium]
MLAVSLGQLNIEIGLTRRLGSISELEQKVLKNHEELVRFALLDMAIVGISSECHTSVGCFALISDLIRHIYSIQTTSEIHLQIGDNVVLSGYIAGNSVSLKIYVENEKHVLGTYDCSISEYVMILSDLLTKLSRSAEESGLDIRKFIQWSPPISA